MSAHPFPRHATSLVTRTHILPPGSYAWNIQLMCRLYIIYWQFLIIVVLFSCTFRAQTQTAYITQQHAFTHTATASLLPLDVKGVFAACLRAMLRHLLQHSKVFSLPQLWRERDPRKTRQSQRNIYCSKSSMCFKTRFRQIKWLIKQIKIVPKKKKPM